MSCVVRLKRARKAEKGVVRLKRERRAKKGGCAACPICLNRERRAEREGRAVPLQPSI